MSKISLSPNASGTGNFTIASPNSNTDRTLTLPDATGTINTSGAVNEVPAGTASAPSIFPTGDTNTGIFFPAADTIGFTEGGAEAIRIDSNGNLLIGTTDTANTSGNGIKLNYGVQQANTPSVGVVGASTSSSHGCYLLYSSTGSAYKFYVTYAGVVNATTTTITAISDQRLKENIRDLDDGLEKVMLLKPRKFDWKEGKGENIKNARGFIAQEIETVFPDMISTWMDEVPKGEEPYKAVNANLIPTLVKAIQEQQTIIETLKADIAELKAKVNV